ncbi:MAG: MFS transporter, partial [Acidimicrobiaceae bacterium]|nr:MFS transporter [Acidimicrobiaceae bacterium]
MSVTTTGEPRRASTVSGLWHRELDQYPNTLPRTAYLGITVVATVMVYYELYVVGSVSNLVLEDLHIGFSLFVTSVAFGNLVGAFGSLFAGLTDRLGRTNVVVVGLIVNAILTGAVIPNMHSKLGFLFFLGLVALVEGVLLVATSALIRDLSPQTGRGRAMGFWTSGPVVGALIVSVVASHTLAAHPEPSAWRHQYYICGIVGIVVAIVALLSMKELSPGLRAQLMVSKRDRALIEARARGIDVDAALRHPAGQMVKPDVVVPAVGISVFLAAYYTAIGFAVIYFTTVFDFSERQANGLGNWNWGFQAIAVILFGFISDGFRVRKPFILIGAVCSAIMLVIFLEQFGKPTGYYHLAVLLAALGFVTGVTYVPWMTSLTETVEHHNPALTATGLAIWGWILRMVVFVLFLIIPHVVNTVNPLVTYGPQAQKYVEQYPAFNVPAPVLTRLQSNPSPANPAFAEACRILGPKCV